MDRERIFANVMPLRVNLSDDESPLHPSFDTIRERVPYWLDDKIASDILYTINCWKYASCDDNLVIYIPSDWVQWSDRWRYDGAKLFGRPVRLDMYTNVPRVAVEIKEKPKRDTA